MYLPVNYYLLQMPKCSLKNRILQLRLITCMFTTLGIIAIIMFFPCGGTYNYTHIPEEILHNELYKGTTPHLVKKHTLCKYDEILQSKKSIDPLDIPMKNDDFSPFGIANGSYVPDCAPEFSVAILVTYRNRQKQLDVFLPYMHNFLRKQNIHYKIYLIEQRDDKPWNKGVLYNIGAKQAIADKFPCLILHDVDLLPLDDSNLYVCTNQPRHLSASLDNFRYVLPYYGLVGGVLAMRADQYEVVDGFSNRFEDWGAEDDDMHARILSHNFSVVRFPRTMSRYTMLRHAPAPRNPNRARVMRENSRARAAPAPRAPPDGMRAVPHHYAQVQQHRLFTSIQVKL